MRRKRMMSCNGADKGSNFALTRKGADFRGVRDSENVVGSLGGRNRKCSRLRVSCAPAAESRKDLIISIAEVMLFDIAALRERGNTCLSREW
jgi:hypothetical protein